MKCENINRDKTRLDKTGGDRVRCFECRRFLLTDRWGGGAPTPGGSSESSRCYPGSSWAPSTGGFFQARPPWSTVSHLTRERLGIPQGKPEGVVSDRKLISKSPGAEMSLRKMDEQIMNVERFGSFNGSKRCLLQLIITLHTRGAPLSPLVFLIKPHLFDQSIRRWYPLISEGQQKYSLTFNFSIKMS